MIPTVSNSFPTLSKLNETVSNLQEAIATRSPPPRPEVSGWAPLGHATGPASPGIVRWKRSLVRRKQLSWQIHPVNFYSLITIVSSNELIAFTIAIDYYAKAIIYDETDL